MLTRRQVALSASALPIVLMGASASASEDDYATAVARIWRPDDGSVSRDRAAVLGEVVRMATLAPSSHNTQCWRFTASANAIDVGPDLSRRCPAVDPDDHHLHVSLGCAVENLVHAALAEGLHASVSVDPAGAITADLAPTVAIRSSLFEAITARQCTRAPFDGKPVSAAELKQLEAAGTSEGVRLLMITDRAAIERVLGHVIEANTVQMHDAAFVAELKSWIRFDDAEAIRTGDGLSTRTTGNPSVPRWVGSPLFDLFYRVASENDKVARQVRSAAGIAVFVSTRADKAGWTEAGRCYQRFALQATALGIRNAMLNQPVEVAALRPRFAEDLGLGGDRPDLVVRFGRGPTMPRSLRRLLYRPLEAVTP